VSKRDSGSFHIPKFVILGIAVVVVIAIVAVSFSTIRSVGTGEVGVVTQWGNVPICGKDDKTNEPIYCQPLGSGIHQVTPIQDEVHIYNTKVQKISANSSSASNDLQTVQTEITINYHIDGSQAPKLHHDVGTGYESVLIAPAIQEATKQNTAKFNADELITKREQVKDAIQSTLTNDLSYRGIIIDSVLITHFDFSDQFNQAIEAKVTAEQNALQAQNKLKQVEFEAQQAVATANGQRDASIAQAQGQAESIKLINEQLKQSPEYVHYLEVQRWDGKLPVVMSGNAPFLLDLKSLQEGAQIPN